MQDWHIELGNDAYLYIIILGILLVVATGAYYRKTTPELPRWLKLFLFSFRTLSIALIVLFLCLPTLVVSYEKVTGDKLAVLIDRSGSMGFDEGGKSRSRQIQDVVEKSDFGLSQEDMIVFSFSDSIEKLPSMLMPPPDSNLTALGAAIRKITTEQNQLNIGGILVLGDGVSNSGPDPLTEAMRAGLPISAIAVGDTIPVPDLSIEGINAPEMVYRGEEIDFDLTLKSDVEEDTQAELEVFSGKKRLQSETVVLPGGGAPKNMKVTMPADSVGQFQYRFSLKGNFSEKLVANNSRAVSVQVLKDKLEILLVGEAPNWEFSFIKRDLSSNDKYNVSSYLPGGSSKLILQPEDGILSDYDCTFFVGCGNNTFTRFGTEMTGLIGAGKLRALMMFSQATTKSGFVGIIKEISLSEKNRSVVSVSGEFIPYLNHKPIPDPLLRPPSENSTANFSDMPPILSRLVGLVIAPVWEVVMNSRASDGAEVPLLLRREFDGNRFAVINGGPLWRWDFYMNRNEESDSSYKILVENIITWLTLSGQIKPIEVSPDRQLYNSGDIVHFKGRVLDDNFRPIDEASIIINLSQKERGDTSFELQSVGEGKFEGGPGRLSSGEYIYRAKVTVAGDTINVFNGSFQVDEFSEEYRSLTANRKVLREIAANTGGVYFDVEDNPTGPFPLRKGVILEKAALNLYSLPVALAAALLLLIVEWAIRKRRQLP